MHTNTVAVPNQHNGWKVSGRQCLPEFLLRATFAICVFKSALMPWCTCRVSSRGGSPGPGDAWEGVPPHGNPFPMFTVINRNLARMSTAFAACCFLDMGGLFVSVMGQAAYVNCMSSTNQAATSPFCCQQMLVGFLLVRQIEYPSSTHMALVIAPVFLSSMLTAMVCPTPCRQLQQSAGHLVRCPSRFCQISSCFHPAQWASVLACVVLT